jgi:Ubiquitin-2 like Rad60 SUMO-like
MFLPRAPSSSTHLLLCHFFFFADGRRDLFQDQKDDQNVQGQSTSLRFLLDGERIDKDSTPKMLELDDQDQIDCMLEQTGGGVV